MHLHRARPVVVSASTADHCLTCGVRTTSVCNAIPDTDMARLAGAAEPLEIARGHTFIEEGQPAGNFYNVTGGTAKLYKLLPDGRQQITGFAGRGHFLGLAHSNTYAFTAEAIEPVRLCRFTRTRLTALIHDFPQLEQRLLDFACNELATAQEQMLLLGRKTARERVASFLAMRLREADPCGHAREMHLPMTRGEIADYLGLTIETVSRVFSRFRAEKRIALPSNDRVVVLDQTWLRALAEGSMED